MRITILLLCVAGLCGIARAGDATAGAAPSGGPGISVIGTSTTKVRPSVVEINASITADAELTNDARVKVRDARQRIADALETKNVGATLESRGYSVNPLADPNVAAALARVQQQQILIQNGVVVQQPMNQPDLVRRFAVTEQVKLVLKDADKLDPPKLLETVLRTIDAAREGGLKFGQSDSMVNGYTSVQPIPSAPLVVCRAQDTMGAREQAYKAALDDARQKASRLAEMAGVKIGKVIGVAELDNAAAQVATVDKESDLSSTLLGEMSLNVRLTVQFEIVR